MRINSFKDRWLPTFRTEIQCYISPTVFAICHVYTMLQVINLLIFEDSILIMLCRSLALASYRLEFVQKYYRLCQSMLHLSVVLYKPPSPAKKRELMSFSVTTPFAESFVYFVQPFK